MQNGRRDIRPGRFQEIDSHEVPQPNTSRIEPQQTQATPPRKPPDELSPLPHPRGVDPRRLCRRGRHVPRPRAVIQPRKGGSHLCRNPRRGRKSASRKIRTIQTSPNTHRPRQTSCRISKIQEPQRRPGRCDIFHKSRQNRYWPSACQPAHTAPIPEKSANAATAPCCQKQSEPAPKQSCKKFRLPKRKSANQAPSGPPGLPRGRLPLAPNGAYNSREPFHRRKNL